MRSCGGSSSAGRGTRSCRSESGRSCCHHGCTACPIVSVSVCPLNCLVTVPPPGVDGVVARPRNFDIWRVAVGDGITHLSRVDLLTAEGVVVGTHVGGVGAVPVVLVVGLSSVAVGGRN
jgi:hypothetical protein